MRCYTVGTFQKLFSFYKQHKTLLANLDNDIMDLFRYFCGRNMILEASRVLGCDKVNKDTLEESENEDMQTDSILHDNTSGDSLEM